MDDHARPLREHRGQQRAIEAHSRHQVEGELRLPLAVIEHGEATRWRLGSAEHVDDDVDAAECVEHRLGDTRTTLRCRDVCRDVVHSVWPLSWNRASRRHDRRAVLAQHFNDGRANPFRASRHERTRPVIPRSKLTR
jgi:hypothetical protein